MTTRFTISILAAALATTAVALAAPAPHPFDAYVDHVSKELGETGRKREEIRDEAMETLRREGKFSDRDLERVRREERKTDRAVEIEMIDVLRKSESFQARTGLAAIGLQAASKKAGATFDAMKNKKPGKSVTQTYRITFAGDYGTSAETEKARVLEEMPEFFAKYSSDVEWKIVKKGKGFIDVQLTAENANRIEGWINSLPYLAQDHISGVTKLKAALEGAFDGTMAEAVAKARGNKYIAAIGKATDPALETFNKLARKEADGNQGAGTVTTAYRIKGDGAIRAGETRLDMIERLVKYSLHRDFPITGDEDGYGFTRLSKNITEEQLERETRSMDWLFREESSVGAAKIKAAIIKATHKGLLVLVGGGSGNNTMAEIVVIADPKTGEFVVLMNSNFGSDS